MDELQKLREELQIKAELLELQNLEILRLQNELRNLRRQSALRRNDRDFYRQEARRLKAIAAKKQALFSLVCSDREQT